MCRERKRDEPGRVLVNGTFPGLGDDLVQGGGEFGKGEPERSSSLRRTTWCQGVGAGMVSAVWAEVGALEEVPALFPGVLALAHRVEATPRSRDEA